MIPLLFALCAQTEGANLSVAIEADGALTRTQSTALIITASNNSVGTLDDVDLVLEVASDDAGIGVTAGCDESDDGAVQTVTCPVGSLTRSTSVSLRVNVVPNVDGDLRVVLRGTTSTVGEDAADNIIETTFAVAPFVPTDEDNDDGGCASARGGLASLIALGALLPQSRMRRSGRAKPASASASTR